MNKIVFFDTETTGLPNWKTRSDDPSQPHLVQLSAIQCDLETEKILNEFDVIVKPDGWEIPEEVSKIHGITQEIAIEKGIPEVEAVQMLLTLTSDSLRCAHNRTFDQRIIRIALKRYPDFNEKYIAIWSGKDDFFCTMLKAKPIMRMLPRNKYGFKSPKLEEAYKYFCGKELGDQAHNSKFDTQACMEVYFAMKKRQQQIDEGSF
jgi:DNA polymerase-3 subunit epsilon